MSFKERFDGLLHGLGLRPDPRSVVQKFEYSLIEYVGSTPDVKRADGQLWRGKILGVQGIGFLIEFADGATEWYEADPRTFDFYNTDLRGFNVAYNARNSIGAETFTNKLAALQRK
jgi:hypothetical protein